MESLSLQRKMMALSICSLLLMAYIDHITGYELVFSAAYLLPVTLCAWYLDRRAVWLMSIASGAATWYVDMLSGRSYSHFMIQYWNSFTCLGISLVTGLLLLRLRDVLIERKKMNSELAQALQKIVESTEEIRKLQNGLQVVCAWTQKIKVGEQWMSPDEFLQTQLHMTLTHGISPQAYKDLIEEIKSPVRL